jgi:hypothetical protein
MTEMRHHDGDKWHGAGMFDQAPATAVQFSVARLPDPYQGCPTMKSKLLQPIRQSHEGVNRKRENAEDSSVPWRARDNPPSRASPPAEALDHKDAPDLLRYDDRRQHRLR